MLNLKSTLALCALLISIGSQAACQVAHFEFSVTISDRSFDDSYLLGQEEVQLKEGDFVQVKNQRTGEVSKFDIGTFTNDGAGNFGVAAISSEEATFFEVFHDHESWHQGLEGFFTTVSGEIVELAQVKDCSYDKLFN